MVSLNAEMYPSMIALHLASPRTEHTDSEPEATIDMRGLDLPDDRLWEIARQGVTCPHDPTFVNGPAADKIGMMMQMLGG